MKCDTCKFWDKTNDSLGSCHRCAPRPVVKETSETGFKEAVLINAAWGLGENVVQGTVNPDEYLVFKPLLDEKRFKPIIGKSLGEKEKKMIYAKGGTHSTKNIDTTKEERRSFVLDDDEVLNLARWALAIEKHYKKAMDIEWAKDGETGELFIVQARPEIGTGWAFAARRRAIIRILPPSSFRRESIPFL